MQTLETVRETMKVRVFYCKNTSGMFGDHLLVGEDGNPLPLNTPTSSTKIYDGQTGAMRLHWVDNIPTEVNFATDYALMWTERVPTYNCTNTSIAERTFAKFNDYERNPLSAENDGQSIVSTSGTHHTSMSIGDIVVVGHLPYIVKNEGFEALGFEVA